MSDALRYMGSVDATVKTPSPERVKEIRDKMEKEFLPHHVAGVRKMVEDIYQHGRDKRKGVSTWQQESHMSHIAAIKRHIDRHCNCEFTDKDSGVLALAHIVCRAEMALACFIQENANGEIYKRTGDRSKSASR